MAREARTHLLWWAESELGASSPAGTQNLIEGCSSFFFNLLSWALDTTFPAGECPCCESCSPSYPSKASLGHHHKGRAL